MLFRSPFDSCLTPEELSFLESSEAFSLSALLDDNVEDLFEVESENFCFDNLNHEPTLEPTTPVQPPTLELKELPSHLKYAFLGSEETYPVVISSVLK